jgi:hypothetical protein
MRGPPGFNPSPLEQVDKPEPLHFGIPDLC